MNISGQAQHVLLICSRLDTPGGIERAIVNTSNLFQSKGNRVTLLVLDAKNTCFYPLHKEIAIIHLQLNFGNIKKGNKIWRKYKLLKDIKALRHTIKKLAPSMILTTEYVFTIAAYLAVGKRIKIYTWEHHHFFWLKKSRFWQMLFNFIYPKVKVICLNKAEADHFKKIGCVTTVIPNFILSSDVPQADLSSKRILTVGWLIERKGFDLLSAVAQKVFAQYPDWKWRIIGEGELKPMLEKPSGNISTNIELIKPWTHKMSGEYADSAIYVMLSRFECFPMVLLEAMSHGVPVVSFDCPTGPSDIIHNKEDGFLIEPENVDAMAWAIIRLIEDEGERKKMGQAAYLNIQRFHKDRIYTLWQNVFSTEN